MYGYGSMNADHKPAIKEDTGWGEPTIYYPQCSCGWYGVTIDSMPAEYVYTLLYENSQLKKLVDKYGSNQIYRQPKVALGVENDAILQILKHINYSPESDAEYVNKSLNNILQKYNKSIAENDFKLALGFTESIQKIVSEMMNMTIRAEIFNNYHSNVADFDSEIYAKKLEAIAEDKNKEGSNNV